MRVRTGTAAAAVLLTMSACSVGSEDRPDGASPGADRSSAGAGSESPAAEGATNPGDPTDPGSATESGDATPTRPLSAAEQRQLDERLLAAAWGNDVPAARRLIRRGADVNWRDDTRQSAHLVAASEGYLDLLRLTLRHGADIAVHDSFDGTGLIRAAERGHDLVVGRLLQTATPIDHVNNLGWTALHEAIVLGEGTPTYQATVRALVAAGADLTKRGGDGRTPLEMARAAGQREIAHTLRRALRARTPSDPNGALLTAARAGDADAAAIAVRAGADLEARDARNRTPLLLAVTADHLSVARLLAALGADPDALDDQHDTPWLVTGVTGSVPMARLLLRFAPDLTIRNRYGGISVIPASERGHAAYVELMTRTATDLDHVNDLGWTALLEAVILGDGGPAHQRIVRALLDAGADPQIADRDGVNALEHARRLGHTEIARLLVR